MVRNGIYKAEYVGSIGLGFGLAYIADGRIHGGDSMIYYVGTFTVHDNGTVTARVKAKPYVDEGYTRAFQMESLFGRENNVVELIGSVTDEEHATLEARSKNAPGIALRIKLSFLEG